MKYRSVIAPRRGGPEVLEVVENDLRPPRKGQARIRVLAASVSLPDVEAHYGRSPSPPRIPFTPGYSVMGEIEAIGRNSISPYQVGDRMAAITVYGGYSEPQANAPLESGRVTGNIVLINQDLAR